MGALTFLEKVFLDDQERLEEVLFVVVFFGGICERKYKIL